MKELSVLFKSLQDNFSSSEIIGVYANRFIAEEAALCYVNRMFSESSECGGSGSDKYDMLHALQKTDLSVPWRVGETDEWLCIKNEFKKIKR